MLIRAIGLRPTVACRCRGSRPARAGEVWNVIPDHAVDDADVRYRRASDLDDALGRLRERVVRQNSGGGTDAAVVESRGLPGAGAHANGDESIVVDRIPARLHPAAERMKRLLSSTE